MKWKTMLARVLKSYDQIVVVSPPTIWRKYLKECGIVSQVTAPRTPQWNDVIERRNYTLLHMV